MPGKTHIFSDGTLNVLNGYSVPGVTPYVGLFSVSPGDDNSPGTELTSGGYSRQTVTFSAPVTDTANVREITNVNDIKFGPATIDWPQLVAWGVFDAQVNGTLWYWTPLGTQKTVYASDMCEFRPGVLIIKEA